MKDFLKFTFATVVGLIITGVLIFFLGIITIAGIASSSDTTVKIKKNTILTMNLEGDLLERGEESDPISELLDLPKSLGLDNTLLAISKAKKDKNIKAIYIKAKGLSTSFASLEEIRDALKDFKTSGKKIYCYADSYSQSMYYLSSIADKIVLNPSGVVDLRGLSAQPMFFKDLLEKIGVEMQIFKVGTFKSAVEPYKQMKMSDANREQLSVYINSVWDKLLSEISEERNISKEELNSLAEQGTALQLAKQAIKQNLVDTLSYKEDFKEYLAKQTNIDEDDINFMGIKSVAKSLLNKPKTGERKIIAVYYAQGGIDGGTSTDEGINSEKVTKDLYKFIDNDDIKAVVLRVNSPGGSAYGSEQIWNAVRKIKEKKPVIISMGDYAASGGYYISCNATKIVAQPMTLTGSIGIFGMIPNTEKLTKKVGVGFDVVKTNKFADFGNIMRPMNSDEKLLMQQMINNGYDLFIGRCAEGRDMTKEQINKIGQGRIWTGTMAKEIGLVDELGGLNKAIEIAKAEAGIQTCSINNYPAKKSFFDKFLSTGKDGIVSTLLSNSEFKDWYEQIEFIKNTDRVQTRLPFVPNFY